MICQQLPYIKDTAKLFSCVADQTWAQFLDSGATVAGFKQRHQGLANDSSIDILVFAPSHTVVCQNRKTTVTDCLSGKQNEFSENPFTVLREQLNRLGMTGDQSTDSEVPFPGGALGFFGYELLYSIEGLPHTKNNDFELPDMAVGIYPVAMVSCHKTKRSWLVDATGENIELCQRWLDFIGDGCSIQERSLGDSWRVAGDLQESLSRRDYQDRFARVKDYLVEGDCYQINLTKRFSVDVQGDAWASYLKMRQLSPAPFGAYMSFPFAKILSNSPEQFIQCVQNKVLTSPIKGTRPRDLSDTDMDQRLADQLAASEKDRAENVMIVDLLRNDIGRVCETGSVAVPRLFGIESYANVHHMVSNIIGKLRSDCHALDLLAACFPGGSVTGAPKRRAMEIIDELEPTRRGVYCGAIGWVDFVGNMQTNIAIRTITEVDGRAYFSAGGGLVIDSLEDEEYQEVLDKAAVMLKIVGLDG